MRRLGLASLTAIAALGTSLVAADARADDATAGAGAGASAGAGAGAGAGAAAAGTPATAEPIVLEAPPPRPYKKSLVLDASGGALFFLGKFSKIAPPGPELHVTLGYELLRWLMVFGEGELAFTDTSNAESSATGKTRVFDIFGFGAGARFTARFGERVGLFIQADVGMLKADIAKRALSNLGFADAESLNPYIGARAGFEWYQVDRHLALGISGQIRDAQGFAKVTSVDTPLVLDAGLSLRYAF